MAFFLHFIFYISKNPITHVSCPHQRNSFKMITSKHLQYFHVTGGSMTIAHPTFAHHDSCSPTVAHRQLLTTTVAHRQLLTDSCSLDNCSPDNCSPDNCSLDNCSPDNCSHDNNQQRQFCTLSLILRRHEWRRTWVSRP